MRQDQVREFWDQKGREYKTDPKATLLDMNLRGLEVKTLMRYTLAKEKMLDIGCSNGYTTIRLAQAQPIDIIGLDFSPVLIKNAKAALRQTRLLKQSRVRFRVANVLKLPVASKALDTVITRGSGEVVIDKVTFQRQGGKPTQTIPYGQPMTIAIHYRVVKTIPKPVFSLALVRDDGLTCVTHRTFFDKQLKKMPPLLPGKGLVSLHFPFLALNSGRYFAEVAVADAMVSVPFGWRRMESFTVIDPPAPNDGPTAGVFIPPARWQIFKRR